MRFAVYVRDDRRGLAVDSGDGFRGLFRDEPGYPGDLDRLVADQVDLSVAAAALQVGQPIGIDAVRLLPPFPSPGKIICIGLNYVEHTGEVGMTLPDYPVVFARFASSLTGHGAPIAMPRQSTQLDYEGELVARARPRRQGYFPQRRARSCRRIFDLQRRHREGLPAQDLAMDGGEELRRYRSVRSVLCPLGGSSTRLQGPAPGHASERPDRCSSAGIADMAFDVESLIVSLSEAFTLSAGDIIVTGTPGGIGMSRRPPLWMKPGDVCEVEISGLGVLRNSIINSL